MNSNLKLDIFPHIFPQAFFERVKAIAEQSPALAAQIKRWLHIPVLWDLEARLRMMDRFKGYKQILTLSLPAIEFLAPHDQSPELARLANDGMAEIVGRHPDYFPAFVASLPMNNVPEALREMDRAIEKLGDEGRETVRVPRNDLPHAVVRQARELRRLVVRREELDRRKRQGEDLLVPRKALHHPQARFQVPQHRDVQPALDLRGKRRTLLRDRLHPLEKRLRKDVREDVELEIRVHEGLKGTDSEFASKGLCLKSVRSRSRPRLRP